MNEESGVKINGKRIKYGTLILALSIFLSILGGVYNVLTKPSVAQVDERIELKSISKNEFQKILIENATINERLEHLMKELRETKSLMTDIYKEMLKKR